MNVLQHSQESYQDPFLGIKFDEHWDETSVTLSPEKGDRITNLVIFYNGGDNYPRGFSLTKATASGTIENFDSFNIAKYGSKRDQLRQYRVPVGSGLMCGWGSRSGGDGNWVEAFGFVFLQPVSFSGSNHVIHGRGCAIFRGRVCK